MLSRSWPCTAAISRHLTLPPESTGSKSAGQACACSDLGKPLISMHSQNVRDSHRRAATLHDPPTSGQGADEDVHAVACRIHFHGHRFVHKLTPMGGSTLAGNGSSTALPYAMRRATAHRGTRKRLFSALAVLLGSAGYSGIGTAGNWIPRAFPIDAHPSGWTKCRSMNCSAAARDRQKAASSSPSTGDRFSLRRALPLGSLSRSRRRLLDHGTVLARRASFTSVPGRRPHPARQADGVQELTASAAESPTKMASPTSRSTAGLRTPHRGQFGGPRRAVPRYGANS